MLKAIVLVALGGALGSVLRYLWGLFMSSLNLGQFPWGILSVNTLGCFLIGLLAGFAVHRNFITSDLQLFLVTGFLGGFTTFSTFSLDTFRLFTNGHTFYALSYLAASIILGLAFVALGYHLIKE